MRWRQEGDITANGTRLHYRRGGAQGRVPLLLLHGITDDGGCWPRATRDLAESHELIAPDARGHGRSGGIESGFSVDLLADDAAVLLQALETGPLLVWGHSMGAITALALAARYPGLVRAAVLEDPPFRDAPPPPRPDADEWLRTLERQTRAERIAQGLAEHPAWGEEVIRPWAEAKEMVQPAVMAHRSDLSTYPWRDTLRQVQCPLLLLTGDPEQGGIVSSGIADQAKQLAPHLQVAHIAGAGHCVHRDRYTEALAVVQKFLGGNSDR